MISFSVKWRKRSALSYLRQATLLVCVAAAESARVAVVDASVADLARSDGVGRLVEAAHRTCGNNFLLKTRMSAPPSLSWQIFGRFGMKRLF